MSTVDCESELYDKYTKSGQYGIVPFPVWCYQKAVDDCVRILLKRNELGECEYDCIERVERLKEW